MTGKKYFMLKTCGTLAAFALMGFSLQANAAKEIIHDAEHYILKSQNGEKWAAADRDLEKQLSALKDQHGTPPNIVYILFDDQQVGAIGNEMIQKQLGYTTPNLNQMS